MRKGKETIGLPAISYDTGKKLATISDLLLDPEQKRVLALAVDGEARPPVARIVLYQNVKAVGRDAVIVHGEESIVHASETSEVAGALQVRTTVAGLRLFTEDGRNLGTIADVYFDEATGEVQGFEVSGGSVPTFPFLGAATTRGKVFVPLPTTMRIGKDVAFVPAETTVEEMPRRGVSAEEGRAPGLGEARSSGEELIKRLGVELERFGELALRAAADQQKRFAIGKVADRDVMAPDGVPIVRQGETIDERAVDEAERQGVLGDLAVAAGASVARDAAQVLRTEARRMLGVRRTPKSRGRVEVTEDTEAKGAEAAKIDKIIGRPSRRMILDQDETIILNIGDVITHESVERVRRAGLLEELLDSELMEEPARTEHERREHTPGERKYDQSEEAEKEHKE